jgi:hypothetical protein
MLAIMMILLGLAVLPVAAVDRVSIPRAWLKPPFASVPLPGAKEMNGRAIKSNALSYYVQQSSWTRLLLTQRTVAKRLRGGGEQHIGREHRRHGCERHLRR